MASFLSKILILLLIPYIAMAEDAEQKNYKPEDFKNTAILQGMNKVTARVSPLKVTVGGDTTKFGNLEIAVEKCWSAPPEETPENEGLLQVWEQIPGEDKKQIFHGWMFASSPAISALEHPVYNISIIRCENSEEPIL